MKKTIKIMLAGMLTVPLLAVGLNIFAPTLQPAYAANTTTCDGTVTGGVVAGAGCAQSTDQPPTLFGTGGIFQTIVNVILYVLGAISVVMLVYGGVRYTVSGGVAANVTAAKNTIMYAIIGLIVALLAYAIVNFVLTNLTGVAQ